MKKHNKQHDARGASFKRIAKSLRRIAREQGFTRMSTMHFVAKAFDEESKLLRSMR